MGAEIPKARFKQELPYILDETFVPQHGLFLDQDTSLLQTLDTITAAEASMPVCGKCATLAAQLAHVDYYLEVLEASILKRDIGAVERGDISRRTHAAAPAESMQHKERLKQTYARVQAMLRDWKDWDDERSIGGALAMVVHSDYHPGEIRQALCTLRV
jgi:hypothetical protein